MPPRVGNNLGRGTVVVAGYAGLLTVYGVLLMPASGLATLVICVGLMGVYYAATDGVVPALTSAVVPPALRGTGLAVVGSASDVGKIVSGVLFGWLWSRFGGELAVGIFMAALAVTLATAGPALRRIQADVESR